MSGRRGEGVMRAKGPHPGAGYLTALAGTVVLTAVFLPLRDQITPLSESLGFLLIVMVAAAVGGLWPGVLASILGFMAFNYFFIPPHNTPFISRPEDVAVLIVFLLLSVLISALLARAQEQAALADAKRRDFESLQSLFGHLVEIRSGRQHYEEVIQRLIEEFRFERGSLFLAVRATVTETVSVGTGTERLSPSWEPGEEGRSERLPLILEGRALGTLVLWAKIRPPLTRAESDILRSFCDQLALIVEGEQLREVEAEAKALRLADERRNALIVAVSGELSQAIARVKSAAAELEGGKTTPVPPPVRDLVKRTYLEADGLISLIANLVDIVRLESGMTEVDIQDVALGEVMPKAVRRLADSPSTLRVFASGYEDETVRADRRLLDRILTNLMQHAARASESAGADRIEVLVTRDGDRTNVAVIDHGNGIPHGNREILFNPDYRSDREAAEVRVSLGLAVVKGFLSLMQGTLWVQSTGPEGATITFSLPAAGREKGVEG